MVVPDVYVCSIGDSGDDIRSTGRSSTLRVEGYRVYREWLVLQVRR